ncbi:tumor necrosis factor-inducible gene 6 protein-like [Ruditapes philippinarum]|uniref:tumor necrosis factor-inducible gene 6 protein-like n=1 Tax=Ruditapes philippinarum TaxID=129788 RepID=UPI00295AC960|nr:tumor necrosis factor-inducible gene 6 protein-like [Ruditapes philippinarum]
MPLFGYKIVWFCIKMLTIMQICSAEQNVKQKARINYKLKVERVFDDIKSKSLSHCLIFCSMQQDCITASFKSPAENCLLSSYDTIDDSGSGPGIPEGLVYADGWTTMTRIRYPVFHAVGQYSAYSMTFEQAQQQCVDYGTTIASPSDLLQARSLGYHACVVGWLSDGTNGYVVQYSAAGCAFSESIIYYNNARANVYCKLN